MFTWLFLDKKKKINLNLDLPIHSFGYLNDLSLKTLYSSVDAIVIPSRIGSFGQIASEASACETPLHLKLEDYRM